MRCLLIGNYGVENFGDEALKEYFLRTFPDISWQVLSADPHEGELQRLPTGIRSLFSPWKGTIRAMKEADAVVFGGGSLFTDVESVRACFIWFIHAFVAYHYRTPVMLAFQGIGPFRTRTGAWLARWVVRHAAFISVRDDASMKRLQVWNLDRKFVQTFDPVYSMIQRQNRDSTQKVFIIIPRANSHPSLLQKAVAAKEHYPDASVRIVSLEPRDPREQMHCRTIADAFGTTDIRPIRAMHDLLAALEGGVFVIAERYHGALAALAAGIPYETVMQGKGDKLSELKKMEEAGHDALLQKVKTGETALRNALRA